MKADNIERARTLLLWARKERIQVTAITVGDVDLVCSDLTLYERPSKDDTKAEPKPSIFQEYAGDLMTPPAESSPATVEPTEEDEDDG